MIDDRVKMFEEHAKFGESLRTKALDWLEEYGVDTPNEAMRLLTIAVGVERESVGLSDILKRLKDMEDGDLKDKIAYLMKKGQLTDIKELVEGDDAESIESVE